MSIRTRAVLPVLLGTLLGACGGQAPDPAAAQGKQLANGRQVFEGPVPRAVCGPGSQPETGMQGRTRAVEDVASGRAAEGYWCNLEKVGEEGSQALWQMAWFEDCAYYGIALGNGGVAVVDASDVTNPQRTQTLMTPAMLDPWESLKVNEKRGLLAAVGPGPEGPLAFDVYDISGDCGQPQLLSAAPTHSIGHEGEFAPDGLTYYSSALFAPVVTALDISDPSVPVPLTTLAENIHGLSISDDGTRLYGAETSPNGLVIWDVSHIQDRDVSALAETEPRLVGQVSWEDGSLAQMTIPVTIQGHPYVIFIDEGGSGMARIIDIGDETNPVVIAKLKNEINMPEAEAERAADGGASGFTYQGHYCGVPQRDEPGVLACSYFWQGVRVFDIRDPYQPKEIAYYVSPGTANSSSAVRFVPEKGELWFTDQDHGFIVTRFTNNVWPFTDTAPPVDGGGDAPAAEQSAFGGALPASLLAMLLGLAALRQRRR